MASLLAGVAHRADASDFAFTVVSYVPGTNPANGFTNPQSALGPPERFTGEGIAPSAVTPFQPAFLPSEVVSIGAGGHLTLSFDPPILNDARNPMGIDCIVFGNSFFTDNAYPLASVGSLVQDGGTIELSADGFNWIVVAGVNADGLFPTMGFLDATPYSSVPGRAHTNPHKPVDPVWTMEALQNLSYLELVDAYAGSAGGTGIDIGAAGLQSVIGIRVSVPSGFFPNVEIDAVSRAIPEAAPGDFNSDGRIDGIDLARLLSSFGTSDPIADIDGNGVVDGVDITALLAGWTA